MYNINQFIDGELTGGELAYNVVGTGAGMYATYARGGGTGLVVGTIFFVGEFANGSIQDLKEMQDRNRTSENTITSWGQLMRRLTEFSKWDFGARGKL